jgi:hypothetical protein
MAIVRQNNGLGRGIEQAGGAITEALQYRNQQNRYKEGASTLQKAMEGLGENPTPQAIAQAYNQAIADGAPADLVNSLGSLYSDMQRSQSKSPLNITKPGELSGILQQFGIEQGLADQYDALWPKLTTGGQTALANIVFDQVQRGGQGGGQSPNFQPQSPAAPNAQGAAPTPGQTQPAEGAFQFPKVDPFAGITPKERVGRQAELYKDNVKFYTEGTANYKGKQSEERSVKQLQNLNDSGKLPKGLTKSLNVDWTTGELRVPSAANAETQLFIKTINEFVRKARDSFGARVTNFELDKFLQGLPTLANTEEGRRMILSQMQAINGIDQIYESNIKKVYDHYGLRNIDRQQAEAIAEQMSQKQSEDMVERFYEAPRAQELYEVRKKTPRGHVLIKFEDKFGYVPEEELEVAISQGAKRR